MTDHGHGALGIVTVDTQGVVCTSFRLSPFGTTLGGLHIWKQRGRARVDGAVRSSPVDVCAVRGHALCDRGRCVAVSQTQNRTSSCSSQRYTSAFMSLCLDTSLRDSASSKLIYSLGSSSSSSCGLPHSDQSYLNSTAKFIAERTTNFQSREILLVS